MAYNSTTKVITAPVSVWDVQQCLAKSANDVGTLCVAPNINPWSRYKPIKYPIIFMTDAIRNVETGFFMTDILEGGYTVKQNNYVAPTGGATSPYRLADFNGYKHNAQAYSCAMQNIVFANSPNGTNIHIGSSESVAAFYVTVKLPDFPIWFLPALANAGVIEVWKGRYGVANDVPTLVGSIDIKTLCSADPATYMSNYANTSVQINCTDSSIPLSGESSTVNYYITVGKTYLVSVAYNNVIGKMYKQWDQDYNDENQWIDANITLVDSPENAIEVSYTYIKYLKSKTGDPSYMRINTFDNRMPGFKIRAEYYASGAWRQAFDILPKSGLGSATGNARINNYGTGVTLFNGTSLYIDGNGAISNSFKIANYSGVTDFRYTAIAIL